MTNQGLSGATIWSSTEVGGHIDFRFMRRPIGWLEKLEENEYEMRSPEDTYNQQGTISTLEFHSRCWLHAEMAKGGDLEEYDRELKRWYPVLSQTYVVDKENERTLLYVHQETGEQVKVVDYHRWKVYSDGSYEEYNLLNSLADRRKPQDQNKPTADRPGPTADMPADGLPLTEGVETTIDSAWRNDLDAIWAGESGIPCLVTREEDRPGLKYSEFLTLNETPFAKSPFLKETDTSKYRITRGTGVDNFTNWVWLYRRARADNEPPSASPSPEYDGPCIVLLAKIKWRVEHSHHYKFEKDGKFSGVDPVGSKTMLLNDESKPVDAKWMYFTTFPSPKVYHTRAEFDKGNDGLEFPDIRLDSGVNRWTQWEVFHAKKNAQDVLGNFEPKSVYDAWFNEHLEGFQAVQENHKKRKASHKLHLLLNEAREEFGQPAKFRPMEILGMFKPPKKPKKQQEKEPEKGPE